MYIYIYMLFFVFLSNRCVSHFLVALVFRFDKVYVKIIGDAFYVSSFSFCLFVLCSNALTRIMATQNPTQRREALRKTHFIIVTQSSIT